MLLRGRDRNIVEICDNVNTNVIIYTLRCLGETSVLYANVYCICLPRVRRKSFMGIFIGENGCYCVSQKITAFMSENICMKK